MGLVVSGGSGDVVVDRSCNDASCLGKLGHAQAVVLAERGSAGTPASCR